MLSVVLESTCKFLLRSSARTVSLGASNQIVTADYVQALARHPVTCISRNNTSPVTTTSLCETYLAIPANKIRPPTYLTADRIITRLGQQYMSTVICTATRPTKDVTVTSTRCWLHASVRICTVLTNSLTCTPYEHHLSVTLPLQRVSGQSANASRAPTRY